MNRPLRSLNQILAYRLSLLRLSGKAEQKGPLLNVLLYQMRGDVLDPEVLTATIRAAVDASLIQGIRKVNIYLWFRNQPPDSEPIWTGGFAPPPPEETQSSRSMTWRRDHAGIRVLFFGLGILLGYFFFRANGNALYLLPPGIALLFGGGFPSLKRLVDRFLARLFQRILQGLGLALIGIAMVVAWQSGLDQSLLYTPLALVGILLFCLGI